VGDFNGDGKDDIFRYCPDHAPCENVRSGADVFLSMGSGEPVDPFRFEDTPDPSDPPPEKKRDWTGHGYGTAPNGWYVGDFNGDGKDDIFRYCPSNQPCPGVISGADVFLSTGSGFQRNGSWTGYGYGAAPNGWYVGNFNGKDADGKERDDILRAPSRRGGAEVLQSNGGAFGDPIVLTNTKFQEKGWYIGDFDGDGKDDLMRRQNQDGGAEVLLANSSPIPGCSIDSVVTGVVFATNTFLCSEFDVAGSTRGGELGDSIVDAPPNITVRSGIHACPLGTALVGADFVADIFLCARLPYCVDDTHCPSGQRCKRATGLPVLAGSGRCE